MTFWDWRITSSSVFPVHLTLPSFIAASLSTFSTSLFVPMIFPFEITKSSPTLSISLLPTSLRIPGTDLATFNTGERTQLTIASFLVGSRPSDIAVYLTVSITQEVADTQVRASLVPVLEARLTHWRTFPEPSIQLGSAAVEAMSVVTEAIFFRVSSNPIMSQAFEVIVSPPSLIVFANS